MVGTEKYDVVGAMIEYESGNLSAEDTIDLFQHLLTTGMVWRLQGEYGRTARTLLAAGLIVERSPTATEELAS